MEKKSASNTDNTNNSTTSKHAHPAPAAPPVAETPCFEQAFQRREAAMMALEPTDLLVPNLDVALVTTTVFGVIPKLEALRDEVRAILPGFDAGCFDSVGDCASALLYTHAVYLGAVQPPSELPEKQVRALVVRDTLYSDANGLVLRGLLDAKQIAGFNNRSGYRPVAMDIVGLATLLASDWERFAPCVGTKEHDLVAAHALARELLNDVGVRAASPAQIAEAAMNRKRAFTLLVKTYDQVRRIVIFLRWNEGDADTIAPSLYAGRGNGGSRSTSDPGTDPAGTTPVADGHAAAAPAAATAASAAPTAPAPAAPAVVAPGSGLSASTEPGMPGSNPFAG